MSTSETVFLVSLLMLTGVVVADKVATCTIAATSGSPTVNISGTVTLTQAGTGMATSLMVSLTGFSAADYNQKRGFHIHQYGMLTNMCVSAGGHFNPMTMVHAGPTNMTRHVGDLGNIMVGPTGAVTTTITDTKVSLYAPNSVLNLAIVVHAGTDDLGLGGYTDSNTTGHAGGRIGCCIITEGTGAGTLPLTSPTAILLAALLCVELSTRWRHSD